MLREQPQLAIASADAGSCLVTPDLNANVDLDRVLAIATHGPDGPAVDLLEALADERCEEQRRPVVLASAQGQVRPWRLVQLGAARALAQRKPADGHAAAGDDQLAYRGGRDLLGPAIAVHVDLDGRW